MLILKSCPFCGDDAEAAWESGRYGTFGYIECGLCGARSKTRKLLEPSSFENEKEFLDQSAFVVLSKWWNRRAGEN